MSDQEGTTATPEAPTARDLRHSAVDHAGNAVFYGLRGRSGLTAPQKVARLMFAKSELEKAAVDLDAAIALIVDAEGPMTIEPFSLDAPDPADVIAIEAAESASDEAASDDPESDSFESGDQPDNG